MARKKKEETSTEPKETKKNKKKKEEQPEEPVIIKVEEVVKKTCSKCKTENDSDAIYCKNCGIKLEQEEKQSFIQHLSKVFQILSIAIAIDAMFQTRIHLGTSRGDNIVIQYAFLLASTLLLSTIFRIIGNKVTVEKIVKARFAMSYQTARELRIIIMVYIIEILVFIFSNTRLPFLKPGNNYIDHTVGRYIQRYEGVTSYTRVGITNCEREKKSKFLPTYQFFCYEYTYELKFEDGQSCFIKYKTKKNQKIDTESFSYCYKK